MKQIDWMRTIRNFVVFMVMIYTIASVYFITTNRTEFNEYKESNIEHALYENADIIDVILVNVNANTKDVNKRKRNAKIAAIKSYATFTSDYIIYKEVK